MDQQVDAKNGNVSNLSFTLTHPPRLPLALLMKSNVDASASTTRAKMGSKAAVEGMEGVEGVEGNGTSSLIMGDAGSRITTGSHTEVEVERALDLELRRGDRVRLVVQGGPLDKRQQEAVAALRRSGIQVDLQITQLRKTTRLLTTTTTTSTTTSTC